MIKVEASGLKLDIHVGGHGARNVLVQMRNQSPLAIVLPEDLEAEYRPIQGWGR